MPTREYILYGICILYAVGSANGALTSCPDTWIPYKGSCYYFGFAQKVSFIEAWHFCSLKGGYLVEIDDVHEAHFLQNFAEYIVFNDWWIGLSDQDVEGEFQWMHTMSTPTYTNWAPGQPQTGHGGEVEDCAALVKGAGAFSWHDVPCSVTFNAICERSGEDMGIIG